MSGAGHCCTNPNPRETHQDSAYQAEPHIPGRYRIVAVGTQLDRLDRERAVGGESTEKSSASQDAHHQAFPPVFSCAQESLKEEPQQERAKQVNSQGGQRETPRGRNDPIQPVSAQCSGHPPDENKKDESGPDMWTPNGGDLALRRTAGPHQSAHRRCEGPAETRNPAGST